MEMHEHQQDAVDMCVEAVVEGGHVLIKGKAGTGKSTVTKAALKQIKAAASDRKVYATSFTNKAVLRMIEIGFPKDTAMTCNRLLYSTTMYFTIGERTVDADSCKGALKLLNKGLRDEALMIMCNALPATEQDLELGFDMDQIRLNFLAGILNGQATKDPVNELKPDWNRRDIIIVDEVGMLPFEMAEHIKQRYDTVIFMGDHRQLKPVNGQDTINVMEVDAETELTHVYRSGSDILKWAELAERDELGNCGVVSTDKFRDMVLQDYTFIAHTNDDVFRINLLYRNSLGYAGKPRGSGDGGMNNGEGLGEPLIAYNRCTAINKIRRTHDELERMKEADEDAYSAFEIERIPGEPSEVWCVYKRKIAKNETVYATGAKFPYQGDVWVGIQFEKSSHQLWYIPTVDFWNIDARSFKSMRTSGMLDVFFAYAITAHRAQGSEFENVCVKVRDRVVEKMRRDTPEDDDDRARFNYSAITRAKENVVVCSQIQGV